MGNVKKKKKLQEIRLDKAINIIAHKASNINFK